jgi:AAA+ superfamily predicted ATPase/N-acetylglutamate synthase-like GNAT family acetyltransferase
MRGTIRPYQPGDLASILRLWELSGSVPVGSDGLTLDQAVELISSGTASTLVAERDGEVVGVALGSVAGAIGWIYRLGVAPDEESDELAQQLLSELELKLAEGGARKLATVVQDASPPLAAFERYGYRTASAMRYLERELPAIGTSVPAALEELGAHLIHPGLWQELRGLDEAKEIIERRVILPLAEPRLAARHAVSPPRAIVLFGPPGTGKTTFAKGIASRLAWPFVEIEASEIAGEGPEREAKLLAESFGRARTELATAVVFVDEVEDLAAARTEQRKVSPSVTNEFLKQIPRMRELPEHLLVCATNWVSRLDSAFLRPGRFDYVLPVGPPDLEARRAIWSRYVEEITDVDFKLDALVADSELFTPADIEFAARKAAQRAFEREHFDRATHRATEDDFLTAIQSTRPSLSEEILRAFQQDVEQFARY